MDIYVSNLSFQVDDQALHQFFADFGEIRKATVVKDRETGKSRGFGFVDMPDAEAARRAIMNLNGKALLGRPVNVTEARPRPPGGPAERRPTGSSPSGTSASTTSGSGRVAGPPPPRYVGAPPGAAGFGGSGPRAGAGFAGPPAGGSEPGSDTEGEERTRRLRLERHHQSAPKGKKPGARFEEVRRPKVLKGTGDDKWHPKMYTGDDDDDEAMPPRIR